MAQLVQALLPRSLLVFPSPQIISLHLAFSGSRKCLLHGH